MSQELSDIEPKREHWSRVWTEFNGLCV